MRITKRVFDLSISSLAAFAWIPVLIVCSLLLYLIEGRPIFYISMRRTGNKVQPVRKFRTMIRDAEKTYNRLTVDISESDVRFLNTELDSPFYTGIGRMIECFSLTEIPQILLVIKGDMSLVGNRPLPTNVVDAIKDKFYCVEERFDTPAGLTGPPQLVGRKLLSDHDRLALEITYCRMVKEAYSLRVDFLILLYTVLISIKVKKPLTTKQVQELLTSNLKTEIFYPSGLRRRENDRGRKRHELIENALSRSASGI